MNPAFAVALLMLGWHEHGAVPQKPAVFDVGPFHMLVESGIETEARAAAEWVNETGLPVLVELNGHPLPQPLYDVLVYTRFDTDHPAGLFRSQRHSDPWRARIFVCAETLRGRPPRDLAGIFLHEAVHALLVDMIEVDTNYATHHPHFGQGDPHALVHMILVEAYLRLGKNTEARFITKHALTEDDAVQFRELLSLRNTHGWPGVRVILDKLRAPSSPAVRTDTDFLRVIQGVRNELDRGDSTALAAAAALGSSQRDSATETAARTSSPESPGLASRLVRSAGRLHPHFVHFPIAFLWVLLIVELSGAWRTTPAVDGIARFLAWGAAISVLPVVVTGFAFAREWNLPADLLEISHWHRWLSVAAMFFAWGAALFQKDKGKARRRAVYIVMLLMALSTITASGYFEHLLTEGIREMRTLEMPTGMASNTDDVMVWEAARWR
jgi:uncharacterized membrane protein